MRVLHLTKCSITVSPSRILKESRSLIESGMFSEAVVLGTADDGLPSNEEPFPYIRYVRFDFPNRKLPRSKINGLRKLASFDLWAAKSIVEQKPDLVVAHSVFTLPSCIRAAKKLNVPIIYDCHELERGTQGAKGLIGKYIDYIEKTLLPKSDGVLVVNDSIADWYEKEYKSRPTVIKAFPDVRWQKRDNNSNIFRETFGIPEEHTIFLYQGIFTAGRRITQLIEVFKKADPTKHIVFMGTGDMEDIVVAAANEFPNIHFKSIVKSEEVLIYTSSADVGICGVENVCLSYYMCLPNKIMEYVQAEIAIIAPDWPELGKFVRQDDCGWLHSEETEEIIALVNSIDRESARTKALNSAKIAPTLTWESQEDLLLSFVQKVLSQSKN